MRLHKLSLAIMISSLAVTISLLGQTSPPTLQVPASLEPPIITKIFPDQQTYIFSIKQSRLLIFDAKGTVFRDILILNDRPQDIKHHLFDFHVDEEGHIYVLAVWRDKPQPIQSGAFIYDSAGRFKKLVVFSKQVDGRKILMDAQKNLVVLGLTSDFYFGKASQLFILHKYSQGGDYLGPYFEVDPRKYVSSRSRNVAEVYSNLRPLIDHLPVGYDAQGRIFAVVPGTSDILLFETGTLARGEMIRLQSPDFEMPHVVEQNTQAKLTGMDPRLIAVQIRDDSIIGDFDNVARYDGPRTQVHRKVRAVYLRGNPVPVSASAITPEAGELIQQVGIRSKSAYILFWPERRIRQIK